MSLLSRYFFACCALLAGGALLMLMPIKETPSGVNESFSYAALLEARTAPKLDASETNPPPKAPSLTAEAAVIYNPLQDMFLYEKNAEKSFGIASITKIMTALVALERVGENDSVEIRASAIATDGNEGSLVTGEHITLKNLIVLMLTTSSNDAAVAIAEHVGFLQGAVSFEESQKIFVRLMNETAKKIGLGNTHFKNPTGLDVDEEAGIASNTSTAKETARLVAYALRYPLLHTLPQTPSVIVSEEGTPYMLSSTHLLLMQEPGVISGKTGFTDTAGGALATVAEIPLGKLSIVVVLNSTRDDRFTDTLRLLDWLRVQ